MISAIAARLAGAIAAGLVVVRGAEYCCTSARGGVAEE